MIGFLGTSSAAYLDMAGGCTCFKEVLYAVSAEGNQLYCCARRCAGVSIHGERPWGSTSRPFEPIPVTRNNRNELISYDCLGFSHGLVVHLKSSDVIFDMTWKPHPVFWELGRRCLNNNILLMAPVYVNQCVHGVMDICRWYSWNKDMALSELRWKLARH